MPPPEQPTPPNPHALAEAQDDAEVFDIMLPPPPSFEIRSSRPIPSGRRRARADVHRDGDWHRSVHVWIVDPARSLIVMQKRSEGKDTFPGRWDLSAAGHVEAGVEDSKETAKRELAEELGILLEDGERELEFAFTCPAGQAHLGGCNCYEDVYFIRRDSDSTDFAAGEAEVSDIRWVGVEGLERAMREGDVAYVPRVDRYIKAFFDCVKEICAEAEKR